MRRLCCTSRWSVSFGAGAACRAAAPPAIPTVEMRSPKATVAVATNFDIRFLFIFSSRTFLLPGLSNRPIAMIRGRLRSPRPLHLPLVRALELRNAARCERPSWREYALRQFRRSQCQPHRHEFLRQIWGQKEFRRVRLRRRREKELKLGDSICCDFVSLDSPFVGSIEFDVPLGG